MNVPQFGEAFHHVLDSGTTLSLMACVFLFIIGSLYVLRRMTAAARPRSVVAEQPPTWGCGYARPEARMQYTATSFALPLIRSFRGLLWPDIRLEKPMGPFPDRSQVATHVPDLAEHDLFAPLLGGVARFSGMLRYVTWSGLPVAREEQRTTAERIGPLRALFGSTVRGLRQGTIQVYLSFIVITLILLFLIESIAAPPMVPPAGGQDSGSVARPGIVE
jgi:hypothetical protein